MASDLIGDPYSKALLHELHLRMYVAYKVEKQFLRQAKGYATSADRVQATTPLIGSCES